ncbi:homing endonuclease [Dickeya phage Ds23CZ]|uniref:Homing endonuclease n=1 Tax=Dickeya phage Ds23CZ TaxID=2686433 RepID=A0A7M3T3U5_9CAUD|nr:homing endonuclease [Dickeya phage Ds23CZ]
MNFERYINFVVACDKSNSGSSAYLEHHHIDPLCMGGEDKPYNICSLTARQHFIAHWMLSRLYPDNLKILQAFNIMFHGTTRVSRNHFNSKAYETLKIKRSSLMKGKFPEHWSEEHHPSKTNSTRFKGKVRVFHKSNPNKSYYVTKEEFESNPDLTSWSKGSTLAYDKDGNKHRVRVDDPRLKDGSLTPSGRIIAQNNRGINNAMFKGHYKTPLGIFVSAKEAAGVHGILWQTVIKRCRDENNKIISHPNTINRSQDLNMNEHSHYIGKSWEELGWGFIPC